MVNRLFYLVVGFLVLILITAISGVLPNNIQQIFSNIAKAIGVIAVIMFMYLFVFYSKKP